MVSSRKSFLDTLMQIFTMLQHLVAEISRFKFLQIWWLLCNPHRNEWPKTFGRCISSGQCSYSCVALQMTFSGVALHIMMFNKDFATRLVNNGWWQMVMDQGYIWAHLSGLSICFQCLSPGITPVGLKCSSSDYSSLPWWERDILTYFEDWLKKSSTDRQTGLNSHSYHGGEIYSHTLRIGLRNLVQTDRQDWAVTHIMGARYTHILWGLAWEI